MGKYTEFKALMSEYNELLDGLLQIESEKIKSIAADELDAVGQCMRKEEAEMLRIKGIDSRREKLLKEMGFEGMTFGQVTEASAAVQKKELQPLYTQMKEKTERLQALAASTKNMLESKLIKAEAVMQTAGGTAYGKDGKVLEGGQLGGRSTHA
jgi:Fe-S oxidoreductase